MTLYKGAILKLENQPTGYQRTFKVLEYSLPTDEETLTESKKRTTQLVRLEIME